jgi:amidohydrolase
MNKLDELTYIRRHLHANPELSGKEFYTSKKVVEIIKRYHPADIIENVGGTGVVAIFDSGTKGETVLFRSELDALPIHETNDLEYRSTVDQVAHMCGHDGHTTILIGLAKRLFEQPLTKGKVVLLFQPAEEDGSGAKAVLADPRFSDIEPDYVFAFHNLPTYPLHQVVVRNNSFTAAVKSIVIKLYGKTAHAAEPENGINPSQAIADILNQLNSISNNHPEREDFQLITPIYISLGDINYGISAGYGEVHLTLRSWTEKQLNILSEKVLHVISSAADTYKIKSEIAWTHHFAANENDPAAVDIIFKSAIENQLSVIHRPYPFKWGEDFGLFTQKYKGAMFGIGAGESNAALHNPDYDFPDAIIPTGVDLFHKIAIKILG